MKVVVTGGSYGIGRGIVKILANKRGYKLGILARSIDILDEICESIKCRGGICIAEKCDLRDPAAVEKSVARLVRALDGVDVLINNAGKIIRKDIFTLTVSEWQEMIETNLNGMFYTVRTVVPHMRAQRKGHIINISSISGKVPLAGGSGYAASKFAVTGFSESLFLEVRQFGIKVTTLFPGSVDTLSHHSGKNVTGENWKITPEDVGECCHNVINTATNNCISQVEVRPLFKPAKL